MPAEAMKQTRSVLVVGVGASRGLGAAIAKRFAQGGYPVVIAGRNAQKLEATANTFKEEGGRAIAVVGDVTRAEDIGRFVAADESLAPLGLAVHNAGGNDPAPFLKVDAESFTRHWREHALGAFHVAQAVIPSLVTRGGGSLFFT